MAGNIVKLDNVENGYRLRYKGESKNIKAKNGREAERLLAAFITDIDSGNHKKRSLYIFSNKSSQYLPGKGIYTKAPKTEDSNRTLSIDKVTTALIETYKQDQQAKGFLCQDNNFLFIRWDGTPVNPFLFSKWFARFLERHSLPHLKWHGLRHCSASILINQDCNTKLISKRLGHSKINTTLDVYSHMFKEADKKAADIMEGVFNTENVQNLSKT